MPIFLLQTWTKKRGDHTRLTFCIQSHLQLSYNPKSSKYQGFRDYSKREVLLRGPIVLTYKIEFNMLIRVYSFNWTFRIAEVFTKVMILRRYLSGDIFHWRKFLFVKTWKCLIVMVSRKGCLHFEVLASYIRSKIHKITVTAFNMTHGMFLMSVWRQFL